jgi:quercetin dioxygenase-like cupin family protein
VNLTLKLRIGVLAGAIMVTAGVVGLHAQQGTPAAVGKVEQILLEALSDTAGKEVWMATASFPAGAKVPRHFHYGDEIHYVLEGSWTVEVAGQPPQTKKAGEWDICARWCTAAPSATHLSSCSSSSSGTKAGRPRQPHRQTDLARLK